MKTILLFAAAAFAQTSEPGLNSIHDPAASPETSEEVAVHLEKRIEDNAPLEDYSGMGGPIEERTHYPPCKRKGPGEDRCIQLYERGVTGKGN
jgi:hypothetical protein